MTKHSWIATCLLITTLIAVGGAAYIVAQDRNGGPIIIREVETVVNTRHVYLSRLEVNDMIYREIDAGRMEWIYLFYDAITGSRTVTHVLLQSALLYEVPVNLLFALCNRESGFDPLAVNGSNSNGTSDFGLLQLNTGTFSTLDEKTLLNPSENVLIGTQYLLTRFENVDSWELAVIAYNGGSGPRIAESALLHLNWVLAYERTFDRDITTAKSQRL